jgi:hypothetical protein
MGPPLDLSAAIRISRFDGQSIWSMDEEKL